jgi:hypothetical protein
MLQVLYPFLSQLVEQVRLALFLIGKNMGQVLLQRIYGLEKSIKLTYVHLIEIFIKRITFSHLEPHVNQ